MLDKELKDRLHLLNYAVEQIYYWIEDKWVKAQHDSLENLWNDDLWHQDGFLQPEWILVRKFSQYIEYYLKIEIQVDRDCLTIIIFDCLDS